VEIAEDIKVAPPPAAQILLPQVFMSTDPLTQKWLRQNVQPYPQNDRVFADVDALLNRISTLRPKSDVYSSVVQHMPQLNAQYLTCALLQRTMTVARNFFYASMGYFPYRFDMRRTTFP